MPYHANCSWHTIPLMLALYNIVLDVLRRYSRAPHESGFGRTSNNEEKNDYSNSG